ncbi:MAG TPA: CoA transferase [Solirubrobacteraceae bacterium]|nr:CoA transferase [Solirubrobacteraceae bacterium]
MMLDVIDHAGAEAATMLAEIDAALGGGARVSTQLGPGGSLASAFGVSDLAQASLAAAGVALARWIGASAGAGAPAVEVDRDLASAWFGSSIRPADGSSPASPWDPLAGDYLAADGWLRLHTNAAHHREAALRVLGHPRTRDGVTEAVRTWRADALEEAVVAAGGAAARMRTVAQWRAHPVGRAISSEPLIMMTRADAGPGESAPGRYGDVNPDMPLRGVRVLDLTRIIAGPVATRTLAGWGAEVLRIDPPGWTEGAGVADLLPGKRCAALDLRTSAGRATFRTLLAGADVLVHGLRADALDRLGFDAATRRALQPDLVDVGLNAYGWTGPWRERRGFDSLVQMSCGIAAAGAVWANRETPTPLPVQALDHATGYLLAAAALTGLRLRRVEACASSWRLSLARTAELLLAHCSVDRACGGGPAGAPTPTADVWTRPDLALEVTPWGALRRLPSPVRVGGRPWRWSSPAGAPGADPPAWRTARFGA